jgi:hypothetical protein
MFYRELSDQYINEGVPFEIDETQYPANWLNLSTPEEKAELGLVEVVQVGFPENQMYYWVSEQLVAAELIITNTPKDLTEVKETATSQTNQIAYSLLFPSDWMVIKATETQTAVPANWNTYRADIRTTANQTKDAIVLAADVDQVSSIMSSIVWPVSPDAPVVAEEPSIEPAV